MPTFDSQKITITLPKSLLERLDAFVPTCQRSTFIMKAVHEQLAILEQVEAIEESAGAWGDEMYPELADENAIDTWLAQLRASWQREPI